MLLRLISIIFLAFLVYTVLRTVFGILKVFRKREGAERRLRERAGGEMAEDPVCHTYIPKSTAIQRQFSGETYYFCGKECADAYSRR